MCNFAGEMINRDMLADILKVAIEAARAPTQLILSGFRSASLVTQHKSDGSPVTHFDREAERVIRAFIAAEQPDDYPVLGEEFGGDTQSAPYRWIVDPIDGTQAFTRGLPTFGTLLAFEDVGARRSLVGVIHLPAMGETYWAARGLGAWCNGKQIRVAPARELRDCMVSAPASALIRLATANESLDQLSAKSPLWRCLSDCAAHAMVARGSLDALVEFGLCRWDIAATEVIIEEAGGICFKRDAPNELGKFDTIFGSEQAVRELAGLFGFDTTNALC